MEEQIFTVMGMTCGGCTASVERAIKSVAPEAEISVDLKSGMVRVCPPGDIEAMKNAVVAAGFDVE